MTVRDSKILVGFGASALIALLSLLLWSGQGLGSNEPGVPTTRGESSFVVHPDYSREFEGTCDPVTVTVSFQSEVVGGEPPYRYAWDFGDGGRSPDPDPSHTYTSIAFLYAITLQVTDAGGAVGTGSLALQPPPPPCATRAGDGLSGNLWIPMTIGAAIALPALFAVALRRF